MEEKRRRGEEKRRRGEEEKQCSGVVECVEWRVR